MGDQSSADGGEALPAVLPSGEPLAEYITRTIKADFRAAVQEDSHITTVRARLRPVFRPAAFFADAVQRFYEAYRKVDTNADASRYERELYHLWEVRDPAVLPLRARMAAAPQPDLGDAPHVTVTLVGRHRVLTALFEAAKTRDALLAQFCDSLRHGTLQALGFLADDHAMELKPIPAPRWGDSAMVCAWREGELRPRAGAPHGTPYYRGLRVTDTPIDQRPSTSIAVERRQSAHDAPNKAPSSRRKPSGLDYRALDTPFAHEMKRMVAAGEARNPTDAARALARQAAGAGKESSKVTRLLARYAVLFSPEQD